MSGEKTEVEVIEPTKDVSTDIIELARPQLPINWDYDKSVKKVSGMLVSWRNITGDILMELWVARELLSKDGVYSRDNCPTSKTWNDYCLETGLAKRTANRWLSRWTTKEEDKNPPPLVIDKHCNIIYSDPPWRYAFSETTSRKIEQKYPTMDMKQLKEYKTEFNDNSLIFMWATAPKLKEALELLDAWSFEYKTHAVWDKEKIGMGYWFRGQHELLMVGVKGKFSPPQQENRVSSVFRIPRTKHSAKPERIMELITEWYPKHIKFEMFRRGKLTEYMIKNNWKAWGNETK